MKTCITNLKVKSAFNGNYVLYESNGDKIRSLSTLDLYLV